MTVKSIAKKLIERLPKRLRYIAAIRLVGSEVFTFPVSDDMFKVIARKGSLLYGVDTGVDASGRYEHSMTKKFYEAVEPGDVVLDVGAGVGIYSLIAARKTDPDLIYAFEPDPITSAWLDVNNRKLVAGRLNVIHEFFQGGNHSQLDVAPSVVKLDIEGGEYNVLLESRDWLNKHRPKLIIEYHERLIREHWGVSPERTRLPLEQLQADGWRLEFNGHHWSANSNNGIPDTTWYPEPPNERSFAVYGTKPEGD